MYKKVMLIDDNDVDLFIGKSYILKTGFAAEVLFMKSAESALEYLRRAQHALFDLPQIIFLDINMPELNGFGFLEKFAKLSLAIRTKCQIIMLSSSINIGDIHRAEANMYVNRYIEKPLDALKLYEICHGKHPLVAA